MVDSRKSITDQLTDADGAALYPLQSLRDIIVSQGGHLQVSGSALGLSVGLTDVQLVGLTAVGSSENMDASIWDTVDGVFAPEFVNSRYILRVIVTIDPPATTRTLTIKLDIGTGPTPSNVIFSGDVVTRPDQLTVAFVIPVFCLETFFANGGRVFFVGTAAYEITSAQLVVFRI